MEFTRNNIKRQLNDGFSKTTYCKKVRGTNEYATLKDMSIQELDFIDVLKDFYIDIQKNYNFLTLNPEWRLSNRQKFILESLSRIYRDITKEEKTNNAIYLHQFDDFYWNVYDYFDDYNNQNDFICKEEIDAVLPYLKNFFELLGQ